MPTTTYDPENPPESAAWLAMPEAERLRVVAHHHMANRLKSGNQKAHAAFHVAVENQAAMGFGPTVRALARLQQQGLCRHDAVHAVSSVLAESIWSGSQSDSTLSTEEAQARLNAAIERLDAAAWLRSHGQ